MKETTQEEIRAITKGVKAIITIGGRVAIGIVKGVNDVYHVTKELKQLTDEEFRKK